MSRFVLVYDPPFGEYFIHSERPTLEDVKHLIKSNRYILDYCWIIESIGSIDVYELMKEG